MSRPKGKKAAPPTAEVVRSAQAEAELPTEPMLDRILLFILLSLIPFRAICGETHTYELLRWLHLGDAPGSATPATTLGIFLLIFACGVVWLTKKLLRGGARPRLGLIGVGLLLLILAGLVSTFAAGQKHLALVGTLDFVGLILYMLVLRQLLRRPWHIRLAMTVVLATGAVVLVKCANQYLYENPETLAFYEQHKAEITAGQDPQVAAGILHDYEQRMKAGSVTGFFVHPNVLASYLILIILASFAVALHKSRRRKGWPFIPPLLLAHAAMATLSLTQSKGAMAAGAVALVLWGLGRLLAGASPDHKRRRQLAYGFAACVVLGTIGVGAVLKSDPSALGRSMLFRTMYWEGGAKIVEANGLWCGVGAENFGRWFPANKDITCPEDVDDPHCWPLKLLVEWGLPALLGMLLIFVGIVRHLTNDPLQADGPTPQTRAGSFILWGAGIIGFVLVWWTAIIGTASIAYLAFMLELTVIAWMTSFFLLAYDGQRPLIGGQSFPGMFSDTTPGVCVGGLVAGAIGFAVHACIDLAMFNSGAATTFFALLAIALATWCMREPSSTPAETGMPRRSESRLAGKLIGAAGFATVLILASLVVRPATLCGSLLETARTNEAPNNWYSYTNSRPYNAYLAAIAANPLDSTAARELSEELLRRVSTPEQANEAETAVDTFSALDPYNGHVPRLRGTLAYRRFMLTNDVKYLASAVEYMRAAIASNPSSIHNRQSVAELLSKLAEATGDTTTRQQAIAAWQDMLKLDEQRVYVSQPHHLTDAQKAGIKQRIDALRQPPSQ